MPPRTRGASVPLAPPGLYPQDATSGSAVIDLISSHLIWAGRTIELEPILLVVLLHRGGHGCPWRTLLAV